MAHECGFTYADFAERNCGSAEIGWWTDSRNIKHCTWPHASLWQPVWVESVICATAQTTPPLDHAHLASSKVGQPVLKIVEFGFLDK